MDPTEQTPLVKQEELVINKHQEYSPSVEDVMTVKNDLVQNTVLPVELIDIIIDSAGYWPHTTTVTTSSTSVRTGDPENENVFILRSYPLGFLPTSDDSANESYQMLPEYKSSYSSMAPRSWPKNKEYPSNATEEVLQKWGSKSLPKEEHCCRKIVFTIKSHDQGWGGGLHRGTYNGSSTWFDVGLERMTAFREAALLESWEIAPSPQFRLFVDDQNSSSANKPKTSTPLVCSLSTILPITTTHDSNDPENSHTFHFLLNPDASALQRNKTATKQTQEHIVTWSSDDDINPESAEANELNNQGRGPATGTGQMVRNLKVGDVITVWAKARYGGWVNVVEEVKIDVYWAV